MRRRPRVEKLGRVSVKTEAFFRRTYEPFGGSEGHMGGIGDGFMNLMIGPFTCVLLSPVGLPAKGISLATAWARPERLLAKEILKRFESFGKIAYEDFPKLLGNPLTREDVSERDVRDALFYLLQVEKVKVERPEGRDGTFCPGTLWRLAKTNP